MLKNPGTEIQKSDYTIIVGCGCTGAGFANTLSKNKRKVLIIDQEVKSLQRLLPTYNGSTAVGDGTDLDQLREVGMGNATFVLSATNSDTTNLMIAQMAKEIFHVKQVIAKLNELEFADVYREFGIKTVAPGALTTVELVRLLDNTEMERIVE
ncbi:MAG TPA: NAD-binding protein [Bacillota bacterium]|nr:NAD-binding protein [Bacillota bacterium]